MKKVWKKKEKRKKKVYQKIIYYLNDDLDISDDFKKSNDDIRPKIKELLSKISKKLLKFIQILKYF